MTESQQRSKTPRFLFLQHCTRCETATVGDLCFYCEEVIRVCYRLTNAQYRDMKKLNLIVPQYKLYLLHCVGTRASASRRVFS